MTDTPARPPLLRRWFGRRPPRRIRVLVWLALLIPGLAAAVAIVATQTVAAKWLLLPRLRSAMDLDIQADGVRISPTGLLVLSGVTCRVPGLAGPGGQVLKARRVIADVDWRAAAGGAPQVRSIQIVGGVVRLSQSVETGEINISEIPVSGGVGTTQLPVIHTTDVLVELGEHRRDHFTAIKVVHLRANLGLGPDSNSYLVSLREIAAGDAGLELRGVTGDAGTELQLTGLSLDSWPLRTFPRGVREFSEELSLDGEVRQARFRAHDQEFRLDVQLAGVSMNLPWLLERPGDPPMRLNGVDGSLSFAPRGVIASLDGALEDLPCAVTLEYDGFDESAPFRGRIECAEYAVGEKPILLPYLPKTVQKQFRRFSGPQAVVRATVNVWRGAGENGTPADVAYEGRVWFREGVASFNKFPYEFRGLNGEARFDNRAITIERVEGRARTGAVLSASGHITPPDGSGLAEIVVNVRDVPMDEALALGLGQARAPILDAVFSQSHYDQLAEQGLISTNDAPPPDAPPRFVLGGSGSVEVAVRHGEDGVRDWTNHVRVHFPTVGVLPRKFPYPMIGRDVTIHIDDDTARIDGALLQGLEGGTARVNAQVALRNPDGSAGLNPVLRIAAEDVPVSPLLFSAIPDADLVGGDGRGVRDMLIDLRPEGLLDALVTVAPRENGDTGFDARVALPALRLRPAPAAGEAPALEAAVRGHLRVNEANLHALIDGEINAPPGIESANAAPAVRGIHLELDAPLRANAGVRFAATLAGADLSAPLESVVRAVHPGAAQRLSALRESRRPEGVVDAALRVNAASGSTAVEVSLLEAQRLAFTALGGRVALDNVSGTATVHPAGDQGQTTIDFEHVRAAAAFDGEPAGTATAHGRLRMSPDGSLLPGSDAAGALEGARFESAFTLAALRAAAPDAVTTRWRNANPVGGYSLRYALGPPDNAAHTGGTPPYAIVILPESLAVTNRGQRIEAASVTGELHLSPGAGRIRAFEAAGDGWTFGGQGDWRSTPGGDASVIAQFALQADSLLPPVKAMLPAEVASALDRIGLRIEGPFTLREAMLRGRQTAAGDRSGSFSGGLTFAGASLDPGVTITQAQGAAALSATLGPGDDRPWYSIGLDLAASRAMGLRLGAARATVEGTPDGIVNVAVESAECHGGRIVARAEVRPDEHAGPGTYETNVTLADVRFGPVHADLFSRSEQDEAPAPTPGAPTAPDESRGTLNAGLTLAGVVGEPATRRGRGHATISGEDAHVLRLPLVLQLIEASNLALPTGARLEFARGDFFVEGDTLAFSDLSVESDAVWIRGYGTMDWSDRTLDLRFNTGSNRRIPLLSAVVEGVRREIVSTSVTGPLNDPKISIGPFAGAGRWLRGAMGRGDPEQRRRMGLLAEESSRRPRPGTLDTIDPARSPAVSRNAGFAGAGADAPVDDALDTQPPPQENP